MSDVVLPAPGFFGKVRTHGDFVSRRLPAEFVKPWDECLQKGMLFGQQSFGAQWLHVYLNMPVWCFALGAGVCGASGWVGVLMPGVDRVGRYFPFTLAAPVQSEDLSGWLKVAQAWYDEATRRALSTLSAEFALERFDGDLNTWGPVGRESVQSPWRLMLEDEVQAREGFGDRLGACVTPTVGAWWSEGSDAVPASLLVGPALPDGQRFAGLLDTANVGWESVVKLRP